MPKSIDIEKENEIIKLSNGNLTISEVAKIVGVTDKVVNRIKNKHNLSFKKSPFAALPIKTQEKIVDLFNNGYNTKDISIMLNLNQQRVYKVLKRNNMGENFTYKDLVIDYMGHTVKINNEELKLTPKEYEILIYLVKNKGIAISREAILSKIWGYTAYCDDRTVDTHIKKLRNNLGKDYRDLITTVRNIGYKFEIK